MEIKTSTFLAILILFQSCYSYKKVDLQNLKIDSNKKYAITTSKKKVDKGKIIEITNNAIILKQKKKTISIPKIYIKQIKIKKKYPEVTKNIIGFIVTPFAFILIMKYMLLRTF